MDAKNYPDAEMNTLATSTGSHEGHSSMTSSPFIRQGFGRVSTASGKFNSKKVTTNIPTNNMMQEGDQGRANDIAACNHILNYINHRPLGYALNGTEDCKNAKNRNFASDDRYTQRCTDRSNTLQYKVNRDPFRVLLSIYMG